MLDEANSNFVNGVVTVIRWGFYAASALIAIAITMALLGALGSLLLKVWRYIADLLSPLFLPIRWLMSGGGKLMGWLGAPRRSALEKARRRMRELGY